MIIFLKNIYILKIKIKYIDDRKLNLFNINFLFS